MSDPRTAHDSLLSVAELEGWTILIDLGLHVVFERGEKTFSVQFDADGACVWCQDGWPSLRPIDQALRILIPITPPRRPRQPGHL